MKLELEDLSRNIEENIDDLMLQYPASKNILYQIELLLSHNVSEQRVEEWFKTNKSSIDIILEYIKAIERSNT